MKKEKVEMNHRTTAVQWEMFNILTNETMAENNVEITSMWQISDVVNDLVTIKQIRNSALLLLLFLVSDGHRTLLNHLVSKPEFLQSLLSPSSDIEHDDVSTNVTHSEFTHKHLRKV